MGCQSSKHQVEPVVANKKTTKKDEEVSGSQFQKIDEFARKAPSSLKNSVEDLVNYIASFSKEPNILTRGFFVWISENISYDVDGYFGRAAKAPHDVLGVMKGGRSVCEGYANVMEALCIQANIPVKKISGYSKGYGHSAAKPITFDKDTDHAWNAVQINGKWFLIDSTWGAGHLDSSNKFKKEFEDFYFLTDPKHFISTHFPYMENNLDESKKWQLLDKPVSLEEFSGNAKYEPAAFKLGVQAVSHTKQYIEVQNEIQMVFKTKTSDEIVLSGRLMLRDGSYLREQSHATFGVPDNGTYKLLVHPPKVGLYDLKIFGKKADDRSLERIPQVMDYAINCTAVQNEDFEFPGSFVDAGVERTVLHEPLSGKLRANTSVNFRISAPHLENIMVGETLLHKTGNMFSGEVKTGSARSNFSVYGTRGDRYSRMQGLYSFTVI